jgi:anti-sigma factor RsiW
MAAKLTCRELIEFLDDYVEERLSAPERARFEDHLARCTRCVEYLQGYRATLRAAAIACEEDAVPPSVPEELVAAILASRQRAQP